MFPQVKLEARLAHMCGTGTNLGLQQVLSAMRQQYDTLKVPGTGPRKCERACVKKWEIRTSGRMLFEES